MASFKVCVVTVLLSIMLSGEVFADGDCMTEPADVVFVLDSSYSIWPPDFQRELEFMEGVIRTFDIGNGTEKSRIAALTFGHGVWPKFYLHTHFTLKDFQAAIGRITYGEGKTTNTGDALRYVRDVMLKEAAGGRENATKIVIVVSDGRSQKTFFTQQMAIQMQEEGIFLFAVSIGSRLDYKELTAIASDPDDEHLYSISNFERLDAIKEQIDSKICGGNDQGRSGSRTDNRERETAEFRANEDVLVLDCTNKEADIFFLVDSSYSINTENFGKEMEFIHSIINILDVGQNKTRIGVLTFSDTSNFDIKLDYVLEKQDYLSHLNAVKYMGGGTDTGTALRRMREEGFFGDNNGDRQGVARIAIVLTDGLSISPDTTAREAQLAKAVGIQIFSVGIGSGIDKRELTDIASEPANNFVMHVDDFNSLTDIKMQLAARSCTVKPKEGLPLLSDKAVCHPFGATDLIFIYDAMALGSWRTQVTSQFIAKSLQEFSLSSGELRVGREIENCPLGNIPFGSALQSSDLDAVKYQTFTTMLKRVRRIRFSPENGARINASKMAVVILDSSQTVNYDTFLEAQDLRDDVDFFFLVTVGSNAHTAAFRGLVTDDKYIGIESYDQLHSFTDKLMGAMCDFFFMSF